MKLVAIYNVPDLPNLEFNHRKYADRHGLQFERIVLGNDSLAERYSAYLEVLQKNIDETIIFVDNNTYFANFDFLPKPEGECIIQKHEDSYVTGLFIVKSNAATTLCFERALTSINTKGFLMGGWQEIKHNKVVFPKGYSKEYPHRQDGMYLCASVYAHNNILAVAKQKAVLAVTFAHTKIKADECDYYAEAMCSRNGILPSIPPEQFECFNPGGKHAFVTMYTPNIAEMGIISEENLKLYCAKNDITYYIYRGVPDDLAAAGVADAWVKPWLILKHFEPHVTVSWIDSDILIGPDWKLDFGREVACFKDPLFTFNSGFMMFATTDKNRALLNDVIASIQSINGKLEGVYNHGGDQPRFIDAVLKHYPGYAPLSARLGNTHPGFPSSIPPAATDKMLHFMGYAKPVRTALMAGYSDVINKKYKC